MGHTATIRHPSGRCGADYGVEVRLDPRGTRRQQAQEPEATQQTPNKDVPCCTGLSASVARPGTQHLSYQPRRHKM